MVNNNNKPGAKPGSAKSKSGAKQRAVASLVGKKAAAGMTKAELYAFWSASVMKVPIPLRTSFGNYTCVNSVARFTVATSIAANTYVWIPWTASALAAMEVAGAGGQPVIQHLFNTLSTSYPLALRPLRMSFSVLNLTTLVNTAGELRVYSLDNAIYSTWTVGATAVTAALSAGGNSELAPLVDSSPDTQEITIASLVQEHEWVSVPASYPAYNTYYDFIPFGNTSDNTGMYSYDILNLLNGARTTNTTYPYSAATTVVSAQNDSHGLGGLPPMRGFIVEIPATPSVQSLRFEVHRQDGARYPVNSLGHTFAQAHPKMDARGEDTLIGMVKHVSQVPAVPLIKEAIAAASATASNFQSALDIAGSIGSALSVASAVSNYSEAISLGAKVGAPLLML